MAVYCVVGQSRPLSLQYIDSALSNYNVSWENVIRFANEALKEAQKENNDSSKAVAYKHIGIAHYYTGNPVQAIEAFEQSLAAFEARGDKKGAANILSNLGGLYESNDEEKSYSYYLKSLSLAEEVKDYFRIATLYNNIGSLLDKKDGTLNKAKDSYRKAIQVSKEHFAEAPERFGEALGMSSNNFGELYLKHYVKLQDSSAENKNRAILKATLDTATGLFREGEKYLKGTSNFPLVLNNLGFTQMISNNFPRALHYYSQSFDEAEKSSNVMYKIKALIGMGLTYQKTGNHSNAINSFKQAEVFAKQSNNNQDLSEALKGLAASYFSLNDFKLAYEHQKRLNDVNKVIYDEQTGNQMANLRLSFDLKKKDDEVQSLSKDREIQDVKLNRQKIVRNALIAGLGLVSLIILILFRNYKNKIATNQILDKQKAEIESLLFNILPEEVAHELRHTGAATPRYYDNVSVMFTDFKGFTALADQLSPQEVIQELDENFKAFDNIIDKYKLEKIKTIGDAYMCAAGIPTPQSGDHYQIMRAALEIRDYVIENNKKQLINGKTPWEIRIGIHMGPLVAGVVGKRKYAYDIWGNTVNIASRMETNVEPGNIAISSKAYEMVKQKFECKYKGKINAKNVGDIDMYYLEAEKSVSKLEFIA